MPYCTCNIAGRGQRHERMPDCPTHRFTVVICGLGRECHTPRQVAAILAADDGWKAEGEYATIHNNETGETFHEYA